MMLMASHICPGGQLMWCLPCRHHLIWVDYFRGMIVAHITHPGNGSTDLQESVLRYVPLPVDPVQDNPYDNDYGRGIEDALELPVVFVTTTMASSSSVLTNIAAVSGFQHHPVVPVRG